RRAEATGRAPGRPAGGRHRLEAPRLQRREGGSTLPLAKNDHGGLRSERREDTRLQHGRLTDAGSPVEDRQRGRAAICLDDALVTLAAVEVRAIALAVGAQPDIGTGDVGGHQPTKRRDRLPTNSSRSTSKISTPRLLHSTCSIGEGAR